MIGFIFDLILLVGIAIVLAVDTVLQSTPPIFGIIMGCLFGYVFTTIVLDYKKAKDNSMYI
jgi:F0F1-type ATP synthase membrane subunit a